MWIAQFMRSFVASLQRSVDGLQRASRHWFSQGLWAAQTGLSYIRWSFQILKWWLRSGAVWTAFAVSGFLNQDLKRENKVLLESAMVLEREWADGSGHIEAEEVFAALSDEEVAWAWQVGHDEYRQELDRWATRIDRSSAVATSTSVVLAVVLGVLSSSLFSPLEPISHFEPLRWYYAFLIVLFHIFCAISLISLLRCVHLSLSVLETGKSVMPAFAEVLMEGMTAVGGIRERRIQSGRLLLYSAARNRWETSRRFNMLDAAVRHQKDGLASLLAASVVWGVHWLMSLQWVYVWFEN